jgi:uncharacterized protein (DUF1330 family)
MGAYVVGFYTTWGQAFPKSYADQALRLVEKHGGRFLVRPSCRWEVLEGDPPHPDPGMVVIEFPSIEKARTWYSDPEYQALLRFRQTSSWRLDAVLVEGR